MRKIAITGGLCSGKSTVAEWMRELGCPVVDADVAGHELLRAGTEATQEVTRTFGVDVLAADGGVDRARLAALVFGPKAEARLELNRILHPRIMAMTDAELQRWERAGFVLAGVEAALLIEENLLGGFDRVVVVVGEAEVRIQRFIERSGGTREQALARMAAQMPDAEKIKRADFVIENSGSPAEARRQVETVMARLESEVRV